MSDLTVQLHSKQCACRGALWMLPLGTSTHCVGPAGDTPPDAVVLSAESWRALGKPRSIESHAVALKRASPQVRAGLATPGAPRPGTS